MILSIIATLETEEQRSFVEEIYYRYHQKMLNICMGILKNRDDAMDALSDTFVQIATHIERFMRFEGNELYGFVAVTARHMALKLYDKKNRRQLHEVSFTCDNDEGEQVLWELPDPAADAEQLLLDKERIGELKTMLRTLTDVQQTILMYKYLYQLSNTEIAELMDLNRATVNSHVHRARLRLQQLMAARDPDVTESEVTGNE